MLGVLLIQLPPSLAMDKNISENFFTILRSIYSGPVAFEPRHESWIDVGAEFLYKKFRLSKVIADPLLCPSHLEYEGEIIYYRLHGTPKIYKSEYSKCVYTKFIRRD